MREGAWVSQQRQPKPYCSFTSILATLVAACILAWASAWRSRAVAFLTANRRGHDHVAKGVRGGTLASYAFESVHGSRADFVAWLELLRQRGHRRMAIGGHSGGAVRATCVQATERFDSVVAVMPVSLGEYTHEGVIALHGEDFSGPFRESERCVASVSPTIHYPMTNLFLRTQVMSPRLTTIQHDHTIF